MPTISKRSAEAFSSPIRQFAIYSREAEASGKYIYYLNIGQPDIPTPPKAMNAVKTMEREVIAYGPSEGAPELRTAYVQYFKTLGHELAMTNVLVTTGASEGIAFALQGCLDRGDEIIVPEPLYALYQGYIQLSGAEIRTITSRIDDGYALPSAEDFEALVTSRTKAIFLCNPNNPTGTMYTREALLALTEVVRKHDLFLIVDEVYRNFCYSDEAFYSALSLPGLEQHVVVLDSVSKRYSACGARIGALISRNQDLLLGIRKFAEYRLSPPVFGQHLATTLLKLEPQYYGIIREEFGRRRAFLVNRLQQMKGVRAYWPGGAFYVLAELPVSDAGEFCKWLLTDFEHQRTTVMLAPGSGFYSTPGLGRSQVRIAYVLRTDELAKAMHCLELALAKYHTLKPSEVTA